MRIALSFLVSLLVLSCGKNAVSTPAPEKLTGVDFGAQARWLHSTLMMATNEAPAGVPSTAYKAFGENLEKGRARFRSEFFAPLDAFLKPLRPADLSKTVLYPFGGSDLAVAIATFPDADVITTISLESAGDPRKLPLTNAKDVLAAIAEVKKFIGHYLVEHDNSHENVWGMENGLLPAQLTFSIGEAAIFGFVPESLRYFKYEKDGSLHFYEQAEIDALENTQGVKIHGGWFNPKCSHAFLNAEVRYRRPDGRLFIHRHVSANLADDHFVGSGLHAHMKGLGKVAVMTKAASYLVWKPEFKGIRDQMMANSQWMVADSTGILPWDAEKGGFKVTAYGTYYNAFVEKTDAFMVSNALALRSWYKSRPYQAMPVRYGYSDWFGSNHFLTYDPK